MNYLKFNDNLSYSLGFAILSDANNDNLSPFCIYGRYFSASLHWLALPEKC